MGVFDELPGLIGDLITDLNAEEGLGFTATYSSITAGSYDPATGTTGAATTTPQDVLAIEENFSQAEMVAGLVEVNDRAIAIPAALLTADPKPTDQVTLGGLAYTVLRLRGVQPGAAPVLHSLHLRRG